MLPEDDDDDGDEGRINKFGRTSDMVVLCVCIIAKADILMSRSHNLGLKCTKFDFRWDSAPDPTGGD